MSPPPSAPRLSEHQRRALATRLAAAEGALHTLLAYAELAADQTPEAEPAAANIAVHVAAFAAACDELFRVYTLPPASRDHRLAAAEQLTKLEAALEDLTLPASVAQGANGEARRRLADLRLTITKLASALQGVQADRR